MPRARQTRTSDKDRSTVGQLATSSRVAKDKLKPVESGSIESDYQAIGQAVLGGTSGIEAERLICNACIGIAGSTHVLLLPIRHDGSNVGIVGSDPLSPTDLAAVSVVLSPRLRGLAIAEPNRWDPDFIPGLGAGHAMAIALTPELDRSLSLVLIKIGPDAFATDAEQILAILASHVFHAIRHARAEEEVRHRKTERMLISRITQTVVTMQGLDLVLAEVATAVCTISEWDACAVAIYASEADGLTIEAAHLSNRLASGFGLVGERIRLNDWQSLRFALDNCSPYQLSLDYPNALTQFERSELARLDLAALLAVPFVVMGEATGLILLSSSTPKLLESKILRTVEEIGVNTALAVQHHQFMEQARQQAEEQSALLRVSQAVISGKDLHVILAEIARVCIGIDEVEASRILLWQPEHNQFEIGAVQSVRDWQTYYHTGDRFPAADWPTSRAVMTSKAAKGFLVSDQELTIRERANHTADQSESFHTFPIMIGDTTVGVLTLLSRNRRRLTSNAVRIGHELAAQAANAIDRANLFGQLRRRAETDGLTGLLNHRAAFETLDRELAAARKLSEPLSIIVVDLDDFKFFNDTHGHLTGDQVLVAVASALRDTCRTRDYVARYGGDEFLIILPGTSPEVASQVAGRLLRRMENAAVEVADMVLPIRISVGVATCPNDAGNRQELIAYADAAMYSAKELGGGQMGSVEKGTRSLEVTVFGALSGLVRAVDRKDRYTKVHSDLVAEYALRFGRYLGLPEHQMEALDIAGQLHDVGKIAVPDSVLRKPGRLGPEEEALIRQHVVFTELIIKGVPHLEEVQAAVAHHHERWDGTGYPYQKKGVEIPLMGRILALADALAAMTHDRPYRKARSLEEATLEIRRGAGSQFDPALVDDFIAAVSTETAILRETVRRHRLNPLNVDPDNPPDVIGLTDFLRLRKEQFELAEDDQRNTA